MAKNERHGAIIEMIGIGRYVKVTAVDTKTGIEASIVGDPRRGDKALRETALKKLDYVLRKKAEEGAR
ncbi:MAG TPA: hypothetical protein DCS82_08135 [Rhodospirillaceae bacterium]|nr:hypothetical protein [Rhodospirillaceae bacterium]HAT35670.1 hypothetical protein [Rhodospirillaceae bacterium]|tara:strand:+ start:1016 stop:1219 length:204 start_codon:yes stop_codon:yes gene_type:complete